MDPGWVRDIRAQCHEARVPFFFKQWGGKRKGRAGRTLDDRTWDAMPHMGLASEDGPNQSASPNGSGLAAAMPC